MLKAILSDVGCLSTQKYLEGHGGPIMAIQLEFTGQ